jgi:hypothetical protein
MNLDQTQQAFGAWLRGGRAPRFGAAARPGLTVYRNAYRAQLSGCLEASFPHTLAWIGGAAFHDAVVSHVARVPPSSWTLDAYARNFPETLGLRYPADPEVAELAMLELALGDAFVAADAVPVSVDALAAVDWDRAKLRFTPTLDLRDATTNAAAIWRALAAGEAPPPAERLPEIAAVMVWRQDMVARFRSIDARERHALLLARAGTDFASLCALLISATDEQAGVAQAGAYLGQWLADGLIVDIYGE